MTVKETGAVLNKTRRRVADAIKAVEGKTGGATYKAVDHVIYNDISVVTFDAIQSIIFLATYAAINEATTRLVNIK